MIATTAWPACLYVNMRIFALRSFLTMISVKSCAFTLFVTYAFELTRIAIASTPSAMFYRFKNCIIRYTFTFMSEILYFVCPKSQLSAHVLPPTEQPRIRWIPTVQLAPSKENKEEPQVQSLPDDAMWNIYQRNFIVKLLQFLTVWKRVPTLFHGTRPDRLAWTEWAFHVQIYPIWSAMHWEKGRILIQPVQKNFSVFCQRSTCLQIL